MAIIGKIRERSGLVVIFVGIGLFAFILGDSLSRSQDLINNFGSWFGISTNSGIGLFNDGEMNSEKWNYETRYQKALNGFKYNDYSQGGDGTVTSEEEDQIRLNTWNQMISDTIYYLELNKLGLSVSADELKQGLLNGENLLPSSLKDMFTQNGVFNKDSFNVWKTNRIINLPDNMESKRDLRDNIEIPLKNERKINKYGAMLKYGIISTIQEGERAYAEDQTSANIKYIFVSYDQIADSTINVTNNDQKEYYNEHRYEQRWHQNQELRSYDYTILKFSPSSKDVSNYKKNVSKLINNFKSTEDDSAFVANHAETPIMIQSQYGPRPSGNYSNQPYKGGKFPSMIDQQIDQSKEGDIIGPFLNGDKIQLVKVYETGEEEQAKVRHILINSKDGDPKDAVNKKLADSILYAIRIDSSKFSKLVTKYSDDPGSVSNGGVYAWFPKGQMVPEFEDFSFSKRIGSSGVVKTNYGYHVIQILGRRDGTFKKIATVDKTIRPSKETKNQFYDSVALELYYKVDSSNFKSICEEMGYEVKSSGYTPLIYPNRRTTGFYGPTELNRNMGVARWAFNAELGGVMEPKYINSNQLAMAVLTEKVNEEDDRFNNLKSLMKPMVENKLKADYFKSAHGDKIANFNNIDSLAREIGQTTGSKLVKYSDVNIGNNMQELAEPKVMAHIFHLNPNEISPIIEGKKGIYIIQLNTINNHPTVTQENSAEKALTDQDEIRKQVDQGYYSALYNAYNVKDHRAKRMLLNN